LAYHYDENWVKKYAGNGKLFANDINPQPNREFKKIFLIGDSTVNFIKSNSDNFTGYQKVGWGNILDVYMKKPENLYNRARPGSSARVYTFDPNHLPNNLTQQNIESIQNQFDLGLYGSNGDLYWAPTKEILQNESRDGDFLLIQFGSGNDRNYYINQGYEHWQRSPEVKNDFKSALKGYIDYARSLNLTPVLITSPGVRAFRNNEIQSWREPLVSWVKEVSAEENVKLLDLNRKSKEVYQRMYNEAGSSCDTIKETFGECNLHDEHVDAVHFYSEGAKIAAKWLRDLACEDPNTPLCKQFLSNPREITLNSDNFIPDHGMPNLSWSNVPKHTKSFVVIIDDYDAPVHIDGQSNRYYTHLGIINIPKNVRSIHNAQLPNGAIFLKNQVGVRGYADPAFPDTHRYVAHIYALNVEDLTNGHGENRFNKIYDHIAFEKIFSHYILGKADLSSR
jgi:Raf kinase inhibitor-like YbhB/YbcL family protein